MAEGPEYALLDRFGAAAIFFPRPDPRPTPPGASDLDIEVAPGITVGARFYAHGRDHPSVLYFHGNGEVASDHDDIAPRYHTIGLNLLVAEFRGYGRSGGQPSFADLVGDALPVAEAFHRHLDEAGYHPRRYVMGRSLGSHPALEIAAHAPRGFAGLITESGAANIQRMLDRFGIPRSPEVEALSRLHQAKVASIRLPTLIIHGAQDDLVPVTQATDLREQLDAVGTPCELLIIPGAGHNDLLWVGAQAYFEAIRNLVESTAG